MHRVHRQDPATGINLRGFGTEMTSIAMAAGATSSQYAFPSRKRELSPSALQLWVFLEKEGSKESLRTRPQMDSSQFGGCHASPEVRGFHTEPGSAMPAAAARPGKARTEGATGWNQVEEPRELSRSSFRAVVV